MIGRGGNHPLGRPANQGHTYSRPLSGLGRVPDGIPGAKSAVCSGRSRPPSSEPTVQRRRLPAIPGPAPFPGRGHPLRRTLRRIPWEKESPGLHPIVYEEVKDWGKLSVMIPPRVPPFKTLQAGLTAVGGEAGAKTHFGVANSFSVFLSRMPRACRGGRRPG